MKGQLFICFWCFTDRNPFSEGNTHHSYSTHTWWVGMTSDDDKAANGDYWCSCEEKPMVSKATTGVHSSFLAAALVIIQFLSLMWAVILNKIYDFLQYPRVQSMRKSSLKFAFLWRPSGRLVCCNCA